MRQGACTSFNYRTSCLQRVSRACKIVPGRPERPAAIQEVRRNSDREHFLHGQRVRAESASRFLGLAALAGFACPGKPDFLRATATARSSALGDARETPACLGPVVVALQSLSQLRLSCRPFGCLPPRVCAWTLASSLGRRGFEPPRAGCWASVGAACTGRGNLSQSGTAPSSNSGIRRRRGSRPPFRS